MQKFTFFLLLHSICSIFSVRYATSQQKKKGKNIAVGTRFLSEDMGKTELIFKMQLAEKANAASCIQLSSQLHRQTDRQTV